MLYEGGFRVPAIIRWPGKIAEGQVLNGIFDGMDWLPTLVAAAGGPQDLPADLLDGFEGYKVHLDGYNQLSYLTGDTPSNRKEIVYYEGTDLQAVRYNDWKAVFMEQRVEATLQAWAEPFIPLRIPLIFNLRRDPYERAQITSNTYYDWLLDRAYLLVPAQAYVAQFLATFEEYPPRQEAASFSLDNVLTKLKENSGSR